MHILRHKQKTKQSTKQSKLQIKNEMANYKKKPALSSCLKLPVLGCRNEYNHLVCRVTGSWVTRTIQLWMIINLVQIIPKLDDFGSESVVQFWNYLNQIYNHP